ncbi:MAG: HDOD domain-containing protein [Gammaproteobacteria bacterium]|nr:HDOD domain-containing protein [Gammaproteobacteria bacterium]NIR98404.1 HDOD domain-containing protein [Gammaproteobacteria bacterium]NIT64158.1 HDOD domain-containing protein [Gammaproteobacteria bacterium]NIV21095.1 HDOD domain-containing protein [Gammaproteobacteria bacterium]NIY32738.1 HDOD domain-containing protein [Gammaproteobacteria bacterium]
MDTTEPGGRHTGGAGETPIGGVSPAQLPAPPEAAAQLMRACASEHFDAGRVASLVASDPGLGAELLRVVNSPFLGLSREVASVNRAVIELGQRALHNLVLCISVREALSRGTPAELDATLYWEDGLRRAVGARILAEHTGSDTGSAFAAGLLADFGLLAIFHVHTDKAPLWRRLRGLDPERRYKAERRHFGVTHDRIIAMLAPTWVLPDELVQVLGNHHHCENSGLADGPRGMCVLLGAADWIAAVYSAEDKGAALEQCRRRLEAAFGLGTEQADALLAAVPEQVQEAAAALGLRVQEQGDFDQVLRQANVRLVEENLSYQELTWRLGKALRERDRLAAELDRELELAREVQESLLPSRHAGAPVFGVNVSARELSGDFYDYFRLPDGRIYFNLADVSGKGITAALLMAKTSSLFRCLGKEVREPGPLLTRINAELCETSRHGMFVTLVAGLYEPASDTVHLVNAGHPPALLLRPDGTAQRIGAHAPPLGVMPEARFPQVSFVLDGASLYLFSDGVTEGVLGDGKMLGIDGLERALRRLAAQPPRKRLETVVGRIVDARDKLRDDVTMLLLEKERGHG